MLKSKILIQIGLVLSVFILLIIGYKYLSKDNIHAVQQIEQSGDPDRILSLSNQLLECDRFSDHKDIAKIVNEVRYAEIKSTSISEILSSMLPHNAEIYQNKDKWEVLRLRSYILLTLSEIGFPDSAIPMLVDAINYIDERMKVVEVGAAINAVGNLGSKGNPFASHIITGFNRVFSDEEFSLSRYEVEFSRDEATTVQNEIIKSLGKICNRNDKNAIKFLNTVIENPAYYRAGPRLVKTAQIALESIQDNPSDLGFKKFLSNILPGKKKTPINLVSNANLTGNDNTWVEKDNRAVLVNNNIALVDHEGKNGNLYDFIDRPILLTFFYTRCQNDRKCSATISHLATLQNNLGDLGINNQVRLLAITFEPQHDNPSRLKRYMTNRGVRLGTQASAIKLEEDGHQALIEELVFPVGYNAGWVNSHGVEAILLDSHARIVRRYDSIIWNTSEIMADFSRLLKEDS